MNLLSLSFLVYHILRQVGISLLMTLVNLIALQPREVPLPIRCLGVAGPGRSQTGQERLDLHKLRRKPMMKSSMARQDVASTPVAMLQARHLYHTQSKIGPKCLISRFSEIYVTQHTLCQ